MMRGVAAVVLALLAGCAESQVAPEGSARAGAPSVRIGASAPAARLSLGRAPERASLVELTVKEVRNPDRESVTLALSMTVDGGAPVPLGNVSLFPVDQPGRFLVRIPPAASAALNTSRERMGELTASLQPASSSRTGSQLALVVAARWAAEPR